MKKNLLFILVLLLPVMVFSQAVTDFFVDFESGIPTEWTVVNANAGPSDNGGTNHTWEIDATHGRNGSQGIWVDTYPGPADDWFISPLTKLTNGYTLTFWADGSGTYPDSIRIMISTSSAAVGDFTINIDTIKVPGSYDKFEFILTDHASLNENDEVYIGLHIYTEGSASNVDELYYGPKEVFARMDAQTVTNAAGQTVTVSSNMAAGFVYIILDGEAQSNLTEFDAAVAADKGAKATVITAYADVSISTEGLVAGMYYAYAVDGSSNISEKSLNSAIVQEAVEVAVDTFFVDFENGLPTEWTIVDVNGGATWVLDNTHGLGDSKCLYNDTYPGPADDWYISPLTRLSDGYVFSMWGYGSATYPDSIAIYASKTGKDVGDFTIEIGRFELPGSYAKFVFIPTDNANLSADEEVYFGIHSFTEGSYTDIDELRYGPFTFGSVYEAFTLSDTELDLIFDDPVGPTGTVAGNWELRGSTTITFSTATVDGSDDKILHLSGASANILPDFVVDSIFNTVTQEYFKMFAGISPVAYANILYPGGWGAEGTEIPATFKAIVMAKNSPDDGRRVWLADGDTAWCGTNSYGSGFYDDVNIGDEIIILSETSPYNNQTELFYPKVMKVVSTGNTLYSPFVMDGSDLDKNLADDTNPAEKYEGLLVKVMNATINSFATPYFFATGDGGTTEFRVGNGLELYDAPFNETLMDIGSVYNITGHVVNRDGDYRIVPRDASDMEFVSASFVQTIEEDKLTVRPNPVTTSIYISAPEIISDLKIYHLTGALVKEYQVNERSVELNISDLPANLYLMKATLNNGKVMISKIMKR